MKKVGFVLAGLIVIVIVASILINKCGEEQWMTVYEIKHGKHYILKKPKLEPLDAKYTSEEQFKKEWAEFEPLIVDVLGIGDWFQEIPDVPNRTIKKSPTSFPETFWKIVTVNGKVGWWNATYSHWIEEKKIRKGKRKKD